MSTSCLKNIEKFWKLKTKNANELFNQGNYAEALNDYKEAMYRAEVLTINNKYCNGTDIPFVQVYIISCNNLANTYQELGNIKEAVEILKRSVYYLLYLVKNNLGNLQEIQAELRKALVHYFNFSKTFNINEEEQLMLSLKNSLLKTQPYEV